MKSVDVNVRVRFGVQRKIWRRWKSDLEVGWIFGTSRRVWWWIIGASKEKGGIFSKVTVII